MSPDECLRALLIACRDNSRLAALDAIEGLNQHITTFGSMPNAQRIICQLLADGFCEGRWRNPSADRGAV